MVDTVTESYLLGIKEGRDYKNRFSPDRAEIGEMIANLNKLISMRFNKTTADTYRGERDFWKNQLKLMEGRKRHD